MSSQAKSKAATITEGGGGRGGVNKQNQRHYYHITLPCQLQEPREMFLLPIQWKDKWQKTQT